MNNNFSSEYKLILQISKEEAIRHRCAEIEPAHLLLAIAKKLDCKAYQLMANLTSAMALDELSQELDNNLFNTNSIDSSYDIAANAQTERIIKLSALEARMLKDDDIRSEHLLLAIFHNVEILNMTFIQNFLSAGISYDKLYAQLKNLSEMPLLNNYAADDIADDDDNMSFENNGNQSKSSSKTEKFTSKKTNDTPVLDKYGIDVTRAAEQNQLDPVVGRDVEIERIAQILSRRKKNNPVLIGEPGVGKSAIVEGLALRIVQRKVSRLLFDKRVISLDMASIVAGTKYRGQFEERIKAILDELSKNKDIILFIDELHTIVGAGNSQGAMDAANMLKPALARGAIQCIGATTLDEYRKHIENDGALERRFQKVMVNATTAEETIQILNNIKEKYEEHHNVIYTPEAIKACVKLTERYISNRSFPDKAIDALDEAGSRVHVTTITAPKEIEELENAINETSQLKLKAAQSQNFESAAAYRDKEHSLREELAKAKQQWEEKLNLDRKVVDEDKIAEVVAMMTGVPVQRIAKAEGKRLAEMSSMLKDEIIGQDAAIEKVTKAIQRNRIGLKDPNKPIGTFMFLGPTGVGKTLLAKKLAEFLFDSADTLIRIDMSEFMEKFTVSRLVGAPPGYVGYEEGGQLTEKVRRRPYSVVLLDEIEKAHPDVFNILLQVMDEGQLTDSLGRTVDFKNTIIIMTSNIGSRQLKEFGNGIGFNINALNKEYSNSVIQKALSKAFSPEFLNRIDDIITFESLDKDAISQIINIELTKFTKRTEELGYTLTITDDAKNYIASQGYDIQYGARPLKRAIQKYVEDKLAELIINETITSGDSIEIDYNNEELLQIINKDKSDSIPKLLDNN